MNKNLRKLLFPSLAAASLLAVSAPVSNAAKTPSWPTTPTLNDSRQQLEQVFANPDDVATGLYWYWLSGNVSPEGVVEDVRSMKRAGITRAYMGFQGLGEHEVPRGPVRIQSPEWYECVRAAMRTAAEEGIEIGVFNCPGWSQSGGPWIKAEQSQRYLGSASVTVKGGESGITLPHPENLLSDVKVLAHKKLPLQSIRFGVDSIVAENVDGVEAILDGNLATNGGFTADQAKITIYPDKKDFTLRSVTLKTDNPVNAVVTVKALKDGKWTEVNKFSVNRTNMMAEVGYDQLAPTASAIPETQAEAFEIDLQINSNCRVAELTVSEQPVVNLYADQILSKMFQTPLPFWEQYKFEASPAYSADAVVAAEDVLDLSEYLEGDRLNWTAPEGGEWIVTRTYMAPTGIVNTPTLPDDGRGYEIDRWSPDALNAHYAGFIGDLLKKIPAEERTTWKYIVSDSYEKGTQTFGDDFIEYFQKHYGYDPTPYLLTYTGTVVGDSDLSQRFLWDLRRMIADRLAYDHLGALRKLANKDGFKLWLEPYGHWGYPGEFMMYGGQSDQVSGEFWSEGSLGDIENRGASSVAHTYGKGTCWSESFTCGGNEFSRTPRTMKQRGDRFFTEGINSTLLHFMVSQPDDSIFPGTNCPFGNEFNRKNTIFSQLDLFTDYLKRANHLLQQGNYVADVAYFIGEDSPAMTGIVDPALPAGFQYDFINAEVIENTLEANADHILSLPHGTTYRVLVLPPLKTMRPELLAKIKQLVEDGAVVIGERPEASPSLQNYPQADIEVKAMADQLWGTEPLSGARKVGNGYILSGMDMQQAFDMLGIVPDFSHTAGKGSDIRYAHLSAPSREIYFISNQQDRPVTFTGIFRAGKGLQPELWDATSGTYRDLPSFGDINGRVSIPMQLGPTESAFIVFERPLAQGVQPVTNPSLKANYPDGKILLALDTPWKVTFTPMVGKGKTVTMPLSDLSKNDDNYIRHFSGTATYSNTFKLKELPEGETILRLGNVRDMARVKVNGKEVGGVWTAPYDVNITGSLKKGKNTIEIEVVNTWVNRLVGDSSLSEEERLTHYNYRSINPKTPLQSAGLMGPVSIETVSYR